MEKQIHEYLIASLFAIIAQLNGASGSNHCEQFRAMEFRLEPRSETRLEFKRIPFWLAHSPHQMEGQS